MNNGSQYSSTSSSQNSSSDSLTDAVVDTMVRWPMRMTGATMDAMIRGVQSMTGSNSTSSSRGSNSGSSSSSSWDSSSSTGSSNSSNQSNSGWSSLFSNQTSGTFDQDLSGDDLKYVMWSIVFTKPGFECVLQKQQEELVNYSADSSTFAAVRIAKFLDSARHGHSERPESWGERGYLSDSGKNKSGRKEKESSTIISTPGSTTIATSGTMSGAGSAGSSDQQRSADSDRGDKGDKGWRIPPEDQKYIQFLYRVDRRLPKQQDEVTRVERVTVERGTRVV
jgi:hypothetical protein